MFGIFEHLQVRIENIENKFNHPDTYNHGTWFEDWIDYRIEKAIQRNIQRIKEVEKYAHDLNDEVMALAEELGYDYRRKTTPSVPEKTTYWQKRKKVNQYR